jgi:hypothetical protein
MRYIVLVDRLPKAYEEGYYSRPIISNEDRSFPSKIASEFLTSEGVKTALNIAKTAMPILAVPALFKNKTNSQVLNQINEVEVELITMIPEAVISENYNNLIKSDLQILDWNLGGLAINNSTFNNNYNLEPKSFFSGVIDSVSKFNTDVLKKTLQSGGGSELIIIEKNKVPKSFHLAGDMGYFSTGIYIQHPKLENKLIPLENSVQHIKDLILEEMVTVLECLGAKKIIIQESSDAEGSFSLGLKKIGIGGNKSKNTTRLTEKEFGQNGLDLERAKKAIAFTADLPKFRSILQAREFGNQTRDYFEESVEINAGVDASVLGIFSSSQSFSLKRNWSMEVEFYDKNQIN